VVISFSIRDPRTRASAEVSLMGSVSMTPF
jgi:hypothetical protein